MVLLAMIIGFVGGVFGLLIGFGLVSIIDTIPFKTEALPTVETCPINMNPMFYYRIFICHVIDVFSRLFTFKKG